MPGFGINQPQEPNLIKFAHFFGDEHQQFLGKKSCSPFVKVCVCACACVCVCLCGSARSACGATTYAEGTRAGEDADEDEDAPPSSTSAVTAAAWRQMCILVRATPPFPAAARWPFPGCTSQLHNSSPEFYSSHVCPTALVGGVAVVGGGCRGDVD